MNRNKMNKIFYGLIVFCFAVFTACSSDDFEVIDPDPDPETPDLTAEYDVYTACFEYNSLGVQVAKCWINDVPVELTDGQYDAGIYSIFIAKK